MIARWGLVPSWAKDIKIGSRLINASSESILDKPSLRKAAVKRRALIPAEGYYEWQKTEDGKKIPNYLNSEKENVLVFAGFYEYWPDPEAMVARQQPRVNALLTHPAGSSDRGSLS